jgi:hypothetical protein
MPLNPLLYNRLCQRFGQVEIADSGSRFVATTTRDPATGGTRLNVVQSGEYYRVNCFCCGDSRKRLWINHRFGTPDPATGRPMLFLAICYNESCLRDFENRRRLDDMVYGFQNRNARNAIRTLPGHYEERELGPATLPGECIPVQDLPPDHLALQYMCGQRQYPLDLLVQYDCSFCVRADPRWRPAQGRIIIPIVMNGCLVGWQGRWPADLDWKVAGVPKYYTMPGLTKRQVLYNFDVARQYQFVVVCEGCSDVWATGPWAVALLGKTLSHPQQQHLLMQWSGKPIVIMLDGGENERSAMQHMVEQLMVNGQRRCPICYVQLPEGRDPGSYQGHSETLLGIIHAQAREAGVTLPTSISTPLTRIEESS